MSECLLSKYSVNSAGYPIKWFNGGSHYHHRLAAKAGPGEVVLHLCDNKRCINPEHLVLGTPADNSKDMVNKNRQAKGESIGNSKLTEEQVVSIRHLFGSLSSRKTAKLFGISATNVKDIWNYKIWRHI